MRKNPFAWKQISCALKAKGIPKPRPQVRLPASNDPLATFESATGVGDGNGRLLSADYARLRVRASGVGRIRPTVGDGYRLAEVVKGPKEDVVVLLKLATRAKLHVGHLIYGS